MSPDSGASCSGTALSVSSIATTRRPLAAAAAAAAAALCSQSQLTRRSVPSAVLRADGWSGDALSPQSQICSTPSAAAVLMIEPTLNGWPTESSSSASLAWVSRRQDRFSRLTSVGRSWRRAAGPVAAGPVMGRPPVPGTRLVPPAGGPASRPRPASAAASPSQPASRSCSAALPTRIGGLDQISPNRAGNAGSPGAAQRTFGSPARCAFSAHSSSARSFTSTAQMVAPGDLAASTSASGPYPQPRSSRSPTAGGSGAVSSSSLVPASSRPGENIPASVRSSRCTSGRTTCTRPGRCGTSGRAVK